MTDRGIPLQNFTASDGNYFPDLVGNYFEGSRYFAERFPSLVEARSDIRLIQVKRLNNSLPESAPFNEANLSWSKDGLYLSFETNLEQKRKIKIRDLSGGYDRELAVSPSGRNSFLNGLVMPSVHSYNAGLSWSKDSTRFSFMSNGGVGEYNIYIGAVGVKEKPIAKSPSKDGYASWNPLRDELAFVSARSGRGDIYLLNIEALSLERLSMDDAADLFPRWFPDGSKIVYCGGEATNHDIFLVERLQSNKWGSPIKITNWTQDDLRPTVSPDGRFIAFYSSSFRSRAYSETSWNIHVIPYQKNKVYYRRDLIQMIVAENVVVDLNTGPAWTPDSRKIFYVKHDPKEFNPIYGYDLYSGRNYILDSKTKMNRDLMISDLGVLSFRAQVGAWDRVFLALTNQGSQLQRPGKNEGKIHFIETKKI